MLKKNYKGRCQKRVLEKCEAVVRTYSAVQYKYADMLQDDDSIRSFACNVLLVGLEEGEFMSAVYIISAYYTVWWLPGNYTMWLRSSMVAEECIRPMIGVVLGCAMILMSWMGGSVYFESKEVL